MEPNPATEAPIASPPAIIAPIGATTTTAAPSPTSSVGVDEATGRVGEYEAGLALEKTFPDFEVGAKLKKLAWYWAHFERIGKVLMDKARETYGTHMSAPTLTKLNNKGNCMSSYA
jgi:hypothetical protein